MTVLTYHEARARAVRRALDENPELILIGSDIAFPFNPEFGLIDDYADRVLLPPISEFSNIAAGVGAAVAGQRVLLPVGTASFMFHGWAAVVQEAANVRYLSGGQSSAPITIHMQSGARRSGAAQHEHTPQAMLQNIPGLRLYQPGTPAEIDAILHASLTANDPCLIFDQIHLIDSEGEVGDEPADANQPTVLREGGDVLVVAAGLMVQRTLSAAERLQGDIDVQVLSKPQISPAPVDTVREIAAGFDTVLFVDECRAPGSPSSYLMSCLLESGTDATVRQLCTEFAPSPFGLAMLDAVVPTVDTIEAAVRGLVAGAATPRKSAA
jgi:pyruvate/2-oxoglutarate/acetoin dehydrogenase E1 component